MIGRGLSRRCVAAIANRRTGGTPDRQEEQGERMSRRSQSSWRSGGAGGIGQALLAGGAAALLGLLVGACRTPEPVARTTACSGDERFMPAGTFPAGYPGSDQTRRRWYALVLARVDEPSLSCGEQTAESYRLIWLHTFAHPVVIRVTRQPDGLQVDGLQLSGVGDGDPGVLLYDVHKRLPQGDWTRLDAALRNAEFWSLATSGNMYGAHGEQWIVEGRRGGRYHVVDRWMPTAGAYRDLGVLFFDLAGWQRPYSSAY